jgi:hypothetical protein
MAALCSSLMLSLVSLLEWTQQILRGLIWLGWLGLDIGVVILVVGLGGLDLGLAALVVGLAVGLDDPAECHCDQ